MEGPVAPAAGTGVPTERVPLASTPTEFQAAAEAAQAFFRSKGFEMSCSSAVRVVPALSRAGGLQGPRRLAS